MDLFQALLIKALSEQGINPRKGYSPRGGCARLIANTQREVLISGPAGTGKSRACLEKIHFICKHWPGARALVIRKTRESLTESALLTFERDVIGYSHPLAQGQERANRQAYAYPNGSRIIVGGLRVSGRDQTQKVMSTDYDLIYVPEAIELAENEWEKLTTRLRSYVVPFQQLMADTNPDKPSHWLKQRCDLGATRLIESRHQDNPRLWDLAGLEWTAEGLAYLATLDALTGPRYDRLRHGRWVQAEGVIYPEWDPATHLIDTFEIPPEWPRYRVVDFGYTAPFVCLWAARDPDGRLYIYRQIYKTQATVRAHSQTIKAHSQGESYRATICDHDAEDRATLSENGIRTVAARKAISRGIEKVRERLRPAGDGKPRLFICRESLIERDQGLVEAKIPWATEQEWDGYIWADTQKEQPIKEHDHGMDAIRYLVMHLDGGPSGPVVYEI